MDAGSAGPCPDLDGNSVLDCQETLVKNPGFDTDISSWNADFGVNEAWLQSDGQGNSRSGSLDVAFVNTTGSPNSIVAGSSQCVQISGGASYLLAVQLQILNGGVSNGGAMLDFWSYASTDCSGSIGDVFQGPLVPQAATWTTTMVSHQIPAAMHSVAVRLLALKPGNTQLLQVTFDNVLFKKQ
jgi:hypothetical protein